MPSVQRFRQFFNERLAAAAEEIFSAFEKTILEYEEEISRQRKLLDIAWKPAVKLSRIELPQQLDCKEEEVVAIDHQLIHQERDSRVDQQGPELPQVKEELCTTQDREHFVLKQETDSFTPPLTYQKGHNTEDQSLCLNPVEAQGAADESVVRIFIKSPEESEPNIDHELSFGISPLAESHDHEGDKHGDSISATHPETRQQMTDHKANYAHNPTVLKNSSEVHSGQKSLKCDTCGKVFQHESRLIRHLTIQTCDKTYSCSVCGKAFCNISVLSAHKRLHTGEKPFPCSTCGKRFRDVTVVKRHMRIHTGQSPYRCNTCGKRFCQLSSLKSHISIHTGEKPFSCKICGKDFRYNRDLPAHMRSHTG